VTWSGWGQVAGASECSNGPPGSVNGGQFPEQLKTRQLLLGKTNKMQSYTIFFIIVTALHVSGGFSAHHQELKNCIHSPWQASLASPSEANSSSAGKEILRIL
jgi:hypothetical protein